MKMETKHIGNLWVTVLRRNFVTVKFHTVKNETLTLHNKRTRKRKLNISRKRK